MDSQELINYQESGSAPTLTKANRAIEAARAMTPLGVRHLFRSRIESDGAGYVWWWVLR